MLQPLELHELPDNALIYQAYDLTKIDPDSWQRRLSEPTSKFRIVSLTRDEEVKTAIRVDDIVEAETLEDAVFAIYDPRRPCYVPIDVEVASAVGHIRMYLEPDSITLTEALQASMLKMS